MTNKEQFDIRTMRYFTHPRKYHTRITKQDEQAMVDLSSRGTKPKRMTKGLNCLIWGKTYRDEQITAYKRDIALGYFTKWEIISSYPKDMRDWITSKIKDVLYDADHWLFDEETETFTATDKGTTPMFIKQYHDMQGGISDE